MIHGLDTSFLVAAEMLEHAEHAAARQTIASLFARGDQLALAPQVVAEFIHVATDPRRFAQPLNTGTARQEVEKWWASNDVVHVYPCDAVMQQFFAWVQQFALGRKRLLDTLLAATYHQAGVQSLLTTNPGDFALFGVFTCVTRQPTTP
jgi:predicted nucleic acid-binding protein